MTTDTTPVPLTGEPSQRAKQVIENLSLVACALDHLGAGEFSDAEQLALNYIASLEAQVERGREDAAALAIYRRAAWEYEPEDGDGGLPRVEWLRILLGELRRYPDLLAKLAEPDPSAMGECLAEADYLVATLAEAVAHRRASRVPDTPSPETER
jgi:hypothetical protein